MARIPKPNYTQAPNVLLDELLPDISTLGELKVTLVVVRHTIGWHEEEAQLTFSELERRTGLARSAVNQGLQRAMERGTIERRVEGPNGAAEVFYTLNLTGSDSLPVPVADSNRDQYDDQTASGSESEPASIERKKEERNTPGAPLASEGGDQARWGEVMEDLRSTVPSVTWHWLENLRLVDRRGDALVLQAPDEQATWIRLRHMDDVESAAARTFGPAATVELPVSETEAMRHELEQRAPRQRRQRRRSA
jgi:DNA-binding HxlR family transcriptional regulator